MSPDPSTPNETEWTHPSVALLAQGRDPVSAITDAARDLVLRGFDRGWNGPPYDPFELAKLLEIPVQPAGLRLDARTVPDPTTGELTIEYNPSRPLARMRFSVAHEIGHLLFEDADEQIRNRTAGGAVPEWTEGNDWQLEVLCNIAAAEILMPAQSLREMQVDYLDIDHLLDVRRRLGVSTEALFRRIAALVTRPVTMFAARQIEGNHERSIQLDYRVDSAAGPAIDEFNVPQGSTLWDFSAIGHASSVREEWENVGLIEIDAVAVPPYPGQQLPRIIGLAQNPADQAELDSYLVEVTGDVFPLPDEGKQMILHLVTDSARRWSGAFATNLARVLPLAAKEYEEWANSQVLPLSLGQAVLIDSLTGPAVCCLIAQEGYGASAAPRIRYQHLASALESAGEYAIDLGAHVHAPAIGTGQARGHWPIIRDQINRSIARKEIAVTIHHLEGRP